MSSNKIPRSGFEAQDHGISSISSLKIQKMMGFSAQKCCDVPDVPWIFWDIFQGSLGFAPPKQG